MLLVAVASFFGICVFFVPLLGARVELIIISQLEPCCEPSGYTIFVSSTVFVSLLVVIAKAKLISFLSTGDGVGVLLHFGAWG